MVLAQDLCRKPSSVGVIFNRFDPAHVLSPAEAYEKVFGEPYMGEGLLRRAEFERLVRAEHEIELVAGMDFGDTHRFTYAGGMKDGRRLFLTRFFAESEVDPEQQMEVSEPLRGYSIYPDIAMKGVVRMFSNHGFKMIPWNKADKKWKGGAGDARGSIGGGISIVRSKLRPIGGGEPELYFVMDVDPDPHTDLFVQAMREWSWKTGPDGEPTDVPLEKWKDETDSVRYCVMNVFAPRAGLATAADPVPEVQLPRGRADRSAGRPRPRAGA